MVINTVGAGESISVKREGQLRSQTESRTSLCPNVHFRPVNPPRQGSLRGQSGVS